MGHKIITAQNGIEGIRICLRDSPLIATVDLDPPKLNGFSIAKILSLIKLGILLYFISSI
ncbi:MAG: hypothetical protein OEY59_01685 [Deltaproteobacteria bacterium]|nr:hypothetical protein [Deltaproteobacteria bacterium]